MFTWNFQYVSKSRLEETLNQLLLNSEKGDFLVRIHTAIHLKDEAVELARFIKHIIPHAHIVSAMPSVFASAKERMSGSASIWNIPIKRVIAEETRISTNTPFFP